jgi:DNA replication protein DnaC
MCRISVGNENGQKILDWIKGRKNMLILLGNPGCGKTYCIAAIANYIVDVSPEIRLFTEDSFMKKLHSSMASKEDYHSELHRLCESEFLVYDDLGSTGQTDFRKEVVFELCDKRYGNMLPTIISSNLTRKDIGEIYHPRIISRIFAKENTIIEMSTEDLRQRE